jgi:hypothetical protein
MIADYCSDDFSFAADKQADLPVNIAGKKGQLPGQIMADNIFRRDAFAAEAFYLFNLSGTQAGSISENFIDSRFTYLFCQYAFFTGWVTG